MDEVSPDPVVRPEQGGDLIIHGRGGIAVATDRMHAELERCALLADAAESALTRLHTARLVAEPGPWLDHADLADAALRRCREQAMDLVRGLRIAAHAYADAEATAEAAQRLMAARGAGLIGTAIRAGGGLPLLALLLTPVTLGTAVSWLVAGKLNPELGTPLDMIGRNPALITSPEFARFVELVVTSADDVFLSVLGVPPDAVLALGDDALGVTGVATAATVALAGLSLAGRGVETPVVVTRSTVRPGAEGAPAGSVDRLNRVPDGGPQLRIERYEAPGKPSRWIVYVGPTADFVLSGDQPWDMTSNLHAVAGGSPASLRAVGLALADAGIAPNDEVQFVGFSQGGIIAARAAASGEWNAVGLETYGSPIGTIDLPDSVHGLTVRHSDDFVPSTGGPDSGGGGVLRVERRAFLPGATFPADLPAPAHQRESYLATATLIDQAASQALASERDALTAFGADYLAAGGTMTVYEYTATRVTDGEAANASAPGVPRAPAIASRSASP